MSTEVQVEPDVSQVMSVHALAVRGRAGSGPVTDTCTGGTSRLIWVTELPTSAVLYCTSQ